MDADEWIEIEAGDDDRTDESRIAEAVAPRSR